MRWRCSVCGYVHEGEQPPETCPVCGAERSAFIRIDETETRQAPQQPAGLFRLHPIAAHLPNGLLPTVILFLLLALVLRQPELENAAFWLLLVAVAAVPVTLGAGLYDWRIWFGGRRAPIFLKKIGLAMALLVFGLVAISLRYAEPQLLGSISWGAGLYLLCLVGMLGCVGLLGHYGATLVYSGLPGSLPVEAAGSTGASDTDLIAAIVSQAPDAILAADAGGIIRLWNRGAERIFGMPAQQAIGQSLDLIIPEKLRERHWQGWRKTMQTGTSRYGEDQLLRVPAQRGDGSRLSAEFSLVMITGEGGRIEAVAAILRDVSEQWQREQRLQQELADCRKPE
ncbi:MAG: PAS domain S-box protein [Desulfuromonadales bacterium]|nr:PAS domain S-box protein [Desulfuromonadales bacterium]